MIIVRGKLYTRALVKVKYDRSIKSYTDRVTIPDEQLVVINTMDMTLRCNCSNCGQVVEYGETWSSKEWYDDSGIWALPVCRECHEREMRLALDDHKTT